MDGFGDQDIGLLGGRFALGKPDRVHAGCAPGVPFTVNPSKAGVAEVETAIFVDGINVGWPRQVESIAANNRRVLQVDSP